MRISGVKRSAIALDVRGRRRTGRVWPVIAALAVAGVVVNGMLSYVNAWPTPGIRPAGLLSVELAVVVLLVALLARRGRLARGASTPYWQSCWWLSCWSTTPT